MKNNIIKVKNIVVDTFQDVMYWAMVYMGKATDIDDALPYKPNLLTLKELFDSVNLTYPTTFDDDIINDLITNLYSKYYDEGFVIRDDVKESKVRISNYAKKLGLLMTKVSMSYDYFSTMINLYKSQKTNLMKDITSSSESRVGYNDTPQNPNTDGKYETDDYLSNVTKSQSSTTTPLGTPMARMREIQENYRSLMESWVNIFDDLFIEMDNIEEVNDDE